MVPHTVFLLLAALTALTTSSTIPLHTRDPPNIPSPPEASRLLDLMVVSPQGPQTGYSRTKFPHWITISGPCNTRETVLKRDGMNVTVGKNCSPKSGSWYSPYDGATLTSPSDVDIDHLVALSDAWKSGASGWTRERRRDFANDMMNPQLISVKDKVNKEKGDKGPDKWKPPLTTYYCTYACMWVQVKSAYNLTITDPEKQALMDMLRTC
ncbi:hypothetical protein RJZ56_008192 [Blastomyces dermatitidis]|uniref:Secreted protein n=2 Tax=Ajellomyces dermatitidis TaxID=5039 RepID=F2TJB3_AJEDA|nr:uncharacterized protein BDCG_01476 [Blastomyces dermatitidis ER-3]EEQ86356.1 secreted protein [Blastomyces dermatitidis ER-3]EGE83326.1 secreted protein [Blastomyces dermatitidis ATCC 18188]